jgi:hypothetical protein
MAPILGIYASQISGHLFAPSGAYDSIATTTVGAGGASTITFSSIPSTYTHLQIRYTARQDASAIGQVFFRVNSDTGGNYSSHLLYGDGGGVAAGSYTSDNYSRTGLLGGTSLASNIFGVATIDILDYANTNKFKTTRTLSGIDANGSGYVWYTSSNWRSTSAVTSLSFFAEHGNFIQNTQFALYGIKGA